MTYLDYNATTPIDSMVLESMIPVFEKQFGNPSSENHDTGREASRLVETARASVANVVGMKPQDVIFTSGATEANNMVLWGHYLFKNMKLNILYSVTEHKSVLEPCKFLSSIGANITKIPVSSDGVLDLQILEQTLSDNPIDLVSVMAANSETGVINPVHAIADLVHKHGALMHCDATQAIGKIPFVTGEIDMVTFSSHKIYGPKGCGALVASRDARKQIQGIMYGGGQENNFRSGTLNVPAIVGFGKACEIVMSKEIPDPSIQNLRDYFEQNMKKEIPDIKINGDNANRLPNTSNIQIKGALADAIIVNAPGVEISTGSACTSSAIEPSHVLIAMGLDTDAANESIRISIGAHTTKSDLEIAIKSIAKAVQYIRGKEIEIQGSLN